MKKSLLLFIFFLFFVFNVKGQNLVPNGDFEQYSGCPSLFYSIDSLSYWMNPAPWSMGGGSPDYFNQCDVINNVGVPNNFQGFQSAYSGVAYCGIYIITFSPNPFWREYIEAPLLSPLISNSCYHFEMYINLSNNAMYSSDNVGVYFSDTLISIINNAYVIPFNPQINISGNYPDSSNWILVSGNYFAHGGENYIVIGNFMNNSNTDTILANLNAPFQGAYIYVDNVSLVQTPCTGIEEQNQNDAIKIYPNPVKDELLVSGLKFLVGKNATMKIYDVTGREAQPETKNLKPETRINVSTLKEGIYLLEINDGKNIFRKKFLKE